MKKMLFLLLLLPAIGMAQHSASGSLKRETTVSKEDLSKYAGEYQLENGFTITISLADHKLYALAQGDQEQVELIPVNGKKFHVKGPEVDVEFIEEEGVIKYMLVSIQGGQKFTKIK